ncbi:hypothetical protein EK21DRAFT_112430 [Setomelanomma holmii]|uniref:CUE domain-containing protein n=1 Tax=Setomelanomma holmii TaxID=210430 RepID=A0A9P4H9E6_9PLEO|nr:hypothetical protein EK21DRAFT_112430 [Setomelanomma holmii]
MASHGPNDSGNPWQDESSQTTRQNDRSGQGYQNPTPYPSYQDQHQPQDPWASDAHQGQYQPPDHPPPHQQPLSSHPPSQHYYSGTESSPYQQDSHPSYPTEQHPAYAAQDQPHLPQHSNEEIPPGLPPRRSGTDLALPTGQDRSHQIEVMQSYEAAGRKDEHDQNVEVLQREFPKIDGSLIAAIYGDSKSLSATREMLGELDTQ